MNQIDDFLGGKPAKDLKPFSGDLDKTSSAGGLQPFNGELDGGSQIDSFLGGADKGGTASDLGKSLKAGVQRLPGMVTGLADLPIALATGARPFTKAADALGEATGFQPGKWADETKFSQGYEDSKKAVDAAWKDGGAGDIAGAYLSNPGYTLNQVAESLPSMVAGGVGSKMLLGAGRVAGVAADAAAGTAAKAATPGLLARTVGEKWAVPVAAGAGEGAVTAGQQMAGYQGEDQQKNALAALGAGAGTGLIGVGAGRLANKMGLETAETAMARIGSRAGSAGGDVPLSLKKRVLGGMVSEAVLQELPQSAQEQMWSNFAQGKPLMDGVARAGTEGALAGAVMGAGANLRGSSPVAAENTGAAEGAASDAQPPAPQLGYSPLAGTPAVFPDGSVALGSEAELAHRYAPRPIKPSEEMGLDPNAGSISKAAVLAVDTGAYMPPAGQAPVAAPEANPVVLQNRDRTSAASIAQMQEIAANPDYLRVGPSRDMTSGAPIVFGDLPPTALLGRPETVVDGHGERMGTQYAVVDAGDLIASNNADGTAVQEYAGGAPGKLRSVAGNGRTAGLQAAYQLGTAQRYRQELAGDAASLGVDAQALGAMQRPVLVRVMQGADVTRDMGDRTNITATQKLSPLEQAGNDARRLDVRTLSFDEGGNPTQDSIKGFVSAMPVAERGDMLNTDGTPTRQAVDRLMAATFKQAYDSDELVQLYAQATDPDARAVMAAAADASGVLASLKDAGELDIRGAVADAAKMAVNASRQGLKLSDVLQNQDMDMNPDAFPVAAFMAENIRTPRKMAEGLRRWGQLALEQARIADENTRQGSLLGPRPTLTRAEVFARLGSEDNPVGQAIAPPAQAAPEPAQTEMAPPDPPPQGEHSGNQADQTQQAASQQPEAPAPNAVKRHPTWRQNAIQAGRVARDLGLEPKGKRLAQIVAEIDARDSEQNQAATPVQQAQAAIGSGAETAALMFSRSVPGPQDFVPSPDGGLDYGEITPEMGKAMRRQAGVIRLQQGVQNADGSGHGLAHIEANHGKQIRNAGFASIPDFVAHIAGNFNEVLQASRGSRLLVAVSTGRRDVMFVQLEATEGGDFYRVNTAFPASRDYLEKQEGKGTKVLWSGSEPRSTATGQQSPYAGNPEVLSGQDAPIARSKNSVGDGSEPTSAVTGQRPAYATAASASPEAMSSQGSSNARGQEASVPPQTPDAKFSRTPEAGKATAAVPKGVAPQFSRATSSVPESAAKWLPDTVIADEVENRIGGFAHQPPIRIRGTAFGQLPGVARNNNVAGAVHDGAIYLFRDQLGDRAAVQRTLFHELLHYGLRKLLTKSQFTSQMLSLYHRDKAIKDEADRWAATADGIRAKEQGGSDYALARGVDEALAVLAEPHGGAYLNQTAHAMFVRRLTRWLADVAQFLKMDKAAAYLRSIKNEEAREYVQSIFKKLQTDASGETVDWSEPTEPAFSRAGPSAIESSMGAMTPEQEAAYKNVAGVQKVPTLKERADTMKANLGLRMKQALVDQFAPIRDVSQHAYMMARMSKASDGAMDALLLYGKPFLRDGVLDVNINDGGFAKMLAGLKGEHDRFFMWVAAQRGERLKAEGKENLMGDTDISALKTLNAGQMVDGTARVPLYAKALQELNAFNEASLKVALESGLIDQDAYDLMKDQPYVPFYRLMAEEGGMTGPKFSSGLLNQKAWKKLKGGTQQLNADLVQNALQNWSHLYAASARNRAALATMDAAQGLGIAYKVAAETKGSVKVMRDGMTEHWMVEDPYLLEAVSALNYTASPLMKPLAKMKQLLTWGVTVNPTFKIRNLIRDSVSAISQSELGYNPLANVGQGWKLTASDSQIYASMLASGGVIKFGTQENTDRLRAQVSKLGGVVLDESGLKKFAGQLQSLYDVYAEFGDRTENVNRAALYDQLIKKGHSHAEASFMARDLMDFSMGGSHPAVRFLTQTVPFLNARLQGLYKLGRAAHADPRKFAAVAGAVSLASLALLAAYGDDEDWKKREDWDRDAYWWFKVGEVAFRIPKPFEVGAIGTLAERTAELMFEKEMTNKRFMERLSFMFGHTFAFDPVPQAFKPLLDIYSNKDSFTKRAIESQADQRLRPQDRYNERTSEVARLLGSWGLPDPAQLIKGEYAGLSPKQIDHLLRGYFSWAGATAATVSDFALRPAMGRGERPDMRLKDVFIAGNFAESLPTGSSRYVSQLYEQSRSVEQAYASYREAIKTGDMDKAAQIQERDGSKLRNRMAYANATGQLSEINAQAKRIEANRLLPGDVKRERLSELELRRGQVAKRLSDMGAG